MITDSEDFAEKLKSSSDPKNKNVNRIIVTNKHYRFFILYSKHTNQLYYFDPLRSITSLKGKENFNNAKSLLKCALNPKISFFFSLPRSSTPDICVFNSILSLLNSSEFVCENNGTYALFDPQLLTATDVTEKPFIMNGDSIMKKNCEFLYKKYSSLKPSSNLKNFPKLTPPEAEEPKTFIEETLKKIKKFLTPSITQPQSSPQRPTATKTPPITTPSPKIPVYEPPSNAKIAKKNTTIVDMNCRFQHTRFRLRGSKQRGRERLRRMYKVVAGRGGRNKNS